jgi:hypothetical protein
MLWAGVFAPWLFPFYTLAGISGTVDTGGLMNYQDPTMALAWGVAILLFNALTILAYSLALVAYGANRHRPGFLPEDAVSVPPAGPPEEVSREQTEISQTEDFTGPA